MVVWPGYEPGSNGRTRRTCCNIFSCLARAATTRQVGSQRVCSIPREELLSHHRNAGQCHLRWSPRPVNGRNSPWTTSAISPMMRPAGMTDQSGTSVVSGVDYGPANELKHMTYNGGTETRT